MTDEIGTTSEPSGLRRALFSGRKEWMIGAARSGLFRRVLPLILLVSLLPIALLAILTGVSVSNIQKLAKDESYNALVDRSLTALELRAVDLSVRVAGFLNEREQDLYQLAAQEPSAENYVAFSQSKRGILWTPDEKLELPMYKEIAFVDTAGQEVIRIVDDTAMPESELRDVSKSENTEYLRETYFQETIDLAPGTAYVQRLMGWYVPVAEAYAHAEKPDGKRYEGVMRFCTPIYRDGEKQGILVLSLDWTHAMELVAHVVGSDEGYVDEIDLDPESGKLQEIHSYMVGDDGWALYHARNHAIVGLDENGEYVPPLNKEDAKAQSESGYIPVNADYMEFLGNEVYPFPWPIIAEENRQGVRSGYVPRYGSAGGVPKAMAWASIPYYAPPYNTLAGFGWVGISIDAAKFTEAPEALEAEIGRRATRTNTWVYVVLAVVTLYAAASIGYLIYRIVARPVGEMVGVAQRIAEGDLAAIEVGGVDGNDELAQLRLALAQMLAHLRTIITRIRGASLHISSSAEEVKATLSEQAGAANQTASAVTETTSTMEELAIIAAQIAERSAIVVEEAAETQRDAHTGAQAVSGTVAELDEIRAANESNVKEIMSLGRKSRRIGEIMELIDNIASRTKLIAFNAALEAAAAGESGRRFSVVAMEVRRLADNVVESTDEIRERIAEIQAATNALVIASEQEAKQIAEGVARGQEATQALTEILEDAQSTMVAAEQISLSTQQQRTAAEQVVDAVRSIQADSQAVARGSQEATHVITDLVQLADELQQVVEQFELGEVPDAPVEALDGNPTGTG